MTARKNSCILSLEDFSTTNIHPPFVYSDFSSVPEFWRESDELGVKAGEVRGQGHIWTFAPLLWYLFVPLKTWRRSPRR